MQFLDLVKELAEQVSEARKLRDKVFEIINHKVEKGFAKKKQFTTHDLVNKSNMGHDQARQMLIHLGKFAFLTTEVVEGKPTHKLIFETEERNKIIDSQMQRLTKEIALMQGSIEYLKALQETNTNNLIVVK